MSEYERISHSTGQVLTIERLDPVPSAAQPDVCISVDLLLPAAAELTRLRAENDRLQALADNLTHNAGRADQEVARLRKAIDDAIRLIDIGRRGKAYTLLCDVLERK